MKRLLTAIAAFAVLGALATPASAQDPADRFGKWQMDSDNPPPFINVMTYEPWGEGGMSITVESTNARGEDNAWGYNTTFDGEFREVWGQEGSETAVEFLDERTTRIYNMRNGRVNQVIINTLSDDGNTIYNEYVRLDEDGVPTGVGHAVYRRIEG